MELRSSPVKEAALKAGLDVLQPRSARTEEFHGQVAVLEPDVAVVVAYGKILPGALLEIPLNGFVNLHFSLLPEYRGAAPVQRALMDGREETGTSVIVLTEGMDEGPVLASEATKIEPLETAGELGRRLALSGSHLLGETLPAYVSGDLGPEPQDDARATYAPKITTEDARIDWTDPAPTIANLVRGLNPDPAAWTTFRGNRVRVLRAQPEDRTDLAPGELEAAGDLVAGTGAGAVRFLQLQMPGKRPMEGREVARGLRLEAGERFE
jgi:methionyl-tRNA formyltransferase